MPRITISITPEFYELLQEHQSRRNLQSLSQALLDLAAVGALKLGYQGNVHLPWGGDRKSQDYLAAIQHELEREEVRILGLPPLADDD